MKFPNELQFASGAFFRHFQTPTLVKSSFIKQNSFSSSSPSSSSPGPSPPCDQNLVSTAISILKHHRSKSRWSYLRSLLTSSNEALTPSQFTQIALQLRNNPHLAHNFFLFTVRHSLCCHSLFSHATIIHILSRSHLKAQAQELIQSAIRKFPDPSLSSPPPIFQTLIRTYRICNSAPFVFDLLVKACIESKRIEQATEIVRMLRSKKICPNISTCNSLIELVSKSRGCFAGYDLYKEIFCSSEKNVNENGKRLKVSGPNSNTFNVLMVGFLRDGLVEKVEEIWREMAGMNCVPNAFSYSVLMAAYCENGRMKDAERVWDEMGVEGLQHDIMAYNTIIGGFCEIGEVGRAEEKFRVMSLGGFESTCVTFEHLISGYCKIGDADTAILLYKDMCRKGFRPDGTTVDAMIKALCDSSKVSDALEIMTMAIKNPNIFPQRKSFEYLIKSLCQVGSMEEALKLQAEMIGNGHELDEEIYGAFIDGYAKQGNEEMARRLRVEMLTILIPTQNG
ncbi:pentatricopeptide repeat-containing protein At2g15980-like [Coffea eugenioides]|uniref:pentatricopeptide repeat-containing protein At2g15980-like n=1 Tax=Coffea eugenioides TaxID=49369 RepID=UPI000F613EE8|nr:pentatricopeptide repeat-containing protein At2g15980-like [Coffea eugenioides]XP_027156578.1 pentatricopeptide repeat-containing protein At2g15980-like [Coffea eugenioides]XP_027157715.1 pentatricopeptide repeat-containing protein At2g15980-like [Coffea eugenioides]XP_027157716.1 pentatricopeptide repeat-containing protein At2g15980-like [Coffea eugenioides]XP_027157717.1 pentatricopeptide repeat-containing protein At2g15980-like [Coffea eugenioides]